MDIQLQELIEKIKNDGIAKANEQASSVLSEAKKKAADIIADAEEKAANIIKAAKAENERMEKASTDAIAQAGRNQLIAFRDSVNAQLNALINTQTKDAYSSDLLSKLIPEAVKEWCKNSNASDISVLLSENDLKALEKSLGSALKAEIEKGLTLKSDNSISGGFRIGIDNGAAFYDYSAESVADLFCQYLNPKTAAILKNAVKA